MSWVDNARLIACFFVILLHVAAGVEKVSLIGTQEWWLGSIYNAASRWCVPIFVIVSGYLLLSPDRKEESLKGFYSKRLDKILIPLLFWSVFYLGWLYLGNYIKGTPISLASMFFRFINGTPYYHMWYLFMVLGLYLVTPFLRTFLYNSKVIDTQLFLIVGFILVIIEGISSSFSSEKESGLFIFNFLVYIPYFVFGYYLHVIQFKKQSKITIGIVILSLVIIMLLSKFFVSTHFDIQKGQYFYGYISLLVIPLTFYVLKLMLWSKRPIIGDKLTGSLSKLSLGIYLIHPIYIDFFDYLGFSAVNYFAALGIPIMTLLIFILTAATSFLVSRLKFVKRLI
jgi:surface polysaccharide O-acyltransferase-like enzyme